MADANRIYAYNVTPMSKAIEAISAAGFEKVTSCDLTDILSTEAFKQAMFENRYGFPLLTEFGKFHYHQFPAHPEFFGEIKACKPRGEGGWEQ